MLAAIEVPLYDIRVLSDRGMLSGLDGIPAAAALDRLSLLKHSNARGSHIYVRPSGEHSFTTLDDLNETSLARLSADGFTPRAVVETSAGSFQAWLKHSRIFPSSLEPSPRRHWPSGTTLTPAPRTGRRFGGCPTLPIANRNTASRTASSLSCACAAMADNSTRRRRPSSKRRAAYRQTESRASSGCRINEIRFRPRAVAIIDSSNLTGRKNS
jgi:hypothetical protein